MSDTLTPPTPSPPSDAPGDDGEGRRRGRSRIAPFVALAIAAAFALLFVVFARSDSNDAESADTRWLNQPAPETTGRLAGTGGNTGVEERTFDLAQRSGSWVVLNFFDSTCGPCVAEHPELVDFDAGQDTLGGDQIELVSILWGRDPARSYEYLQANGLDWDVVYDDGSIANAYGITKVPETWIIDTNGIVRRRYIGEVNAQLLIDTVAAFEAPAR